MIIKMRKSAQRSPCLPDVSTALPPDSPCAKPLSFVVGTMRHKDGTSFIEGYRKMLPNVTLVPAVNGHNLSETINAWMHSGLTLNHISRDGRNWGKVATFLTKYRLLAYQIESGLPYMVTLEDDLILRPSFLDHIRRACLLYDRNPDTDIMQLSTYSEIFMTSLAGAQHVVSKMRCFGMLRSDDQQLFFSRDGIMGHRVNRPCFRCTAKCYRRRVPWALNDTRVPWLVGRRTNSGDITSTAQITWAELAMLRLLTKSPVALLPSHGLPLGADVGIDPYLERRLAFQAQIRATHVRKALLARARMNTTRPQRT